MKFSTLLVSALVVQSAYMSGAMAQAAGIAPAPVATITEVGTAGKALVQLPGGKRLSAQAGMGLPEGSTLIVLEKGLVKTTYAASKCAAVYGANTVLHVNGSKQCGTGTSVISADKYAKFNTASNPGCCVVKTITVPRPPIAMSGLSPASATPLLGLLGSTSALAGIAGLAGLGLLAGAIDSTSNIPPSP